MSTYAVNAFCQRLTIDPTHRECAINDLTQAMAAFDLSPSEKKAIAEGDVATLLSSGVHPLLLVRLHVFGIAGLTEKTYSERIRAMTGQT